MGLQLQAYGPLNNNSFTQDMTTAIEINKWKHEFRMLVFVKSIKEKIILRVRVIQYNIIDVCKDLVQYIVIVVNVDNTKKFKGISAPF